MLIVFLGSFLSCYAGIMLWLELRDEARSEQAMRRVLGA
jgi:hypothetical protein